MSGDWVQKVLKAFPYFVIGSIVLSLVFYTISNSPSAPLGGGGGGDGDDAAGGDPAAAGQLLERLRFEKLGDAGNSRGENLQASVTDGCSGLIFNRPEGAHYIAYYEIAEGRSRGNTFSAVVEQELNVLSGKIDVHVEDVESKAATMVTIHEGERIRVPVNVAYRAEGKQENTILLVIAGGTEAELNLSDYAVASTV